MKETSFYQVETKNCVCAVSGMNGNSLRQERYRIYLPALASLEGDLPEEITGGTVILLPRG